jgi:hypothetical protein
LWDCNLLTGWAIRRFDETQRLEATAYDTLSDYADETLVERLHHLDCRTDDMAFGRMSRIRQKWKETCSRLSQMQQHSHVPHLSKSCLRFCIGLRHLGTSPHFPSVPTPLNASKDPLHAHSLFLCSTQHAIISEQIKRSAPNLRQFLYRHTLCSNLGSSHLQIHCHR